MKLQKIYALVFTVIITMSCSDLKKGQEQPDLKLWYNQPANASVTDNPNGWKDNKEWLKALALGNGSLELMVFGDVNHERIQLKEESMWSGSPNDNDNPKAQKSLDKIRQLLLNGKYKEATRLTNKTQICKVT